MRYSQGGGLTDERRAFRERLRLEAAGLFACGCSNAEIAKRLRVSVRSVQRWRQAWQQRGTPALRSRGSPGRPVPSKESFAVLEAEPLKGPPAHGRPDQTWTLERIKTLIGHRFHKSMTLPGISLMPRRHGWSHQAPARRAAEHNPRQVGGWVKETWPQVEPPRRRSAPGSSSKTRPASR